MGKDNILLRHMTYSGEGKEEGEERGGEEGGITFLYKIAEGADPNRYNLTSFFAPFIIFLIRTSISFFSFGRVVAKMAGIPTSILERARIVALTRDGFTFNVPY